MWAHENPFRSDCIDSLAFRPQRETWEIIEARLRRLNFRAAIIGPKGSGKTTLMEALGERLSREGRAVLHVRLNRERRRPECGWRRLFRQIDRETMLLVDGAEQIPTLPWQVLRHRTRHGAGLIITAHRPGRLPTLHATQTTPQLLGELVRELAGDDVALRTDVAGLFARRSGNLREALFDLYEMSSQG